MFTAPFLSRARLAAWIVLLAALAAAALARVAFAQEPTADFTVAPAAPLEDQRATYRAVLTGDYRGAGVQWDFDADPLGVFEGRGATVRHTYATPGEKQVRMRVILKGEVKAVVTKTVVVRERPVEPVPEPTPVPPPAPVPPPPPPAPAHSSGAAGGRHPDRSGADEAVPGRSDRRPAPALGGAGPAADRAESARRDRDRPLPRRGLSAALTAQAGAQAARSHPESRTPPPRGNPPGDTRAQAEPDREVHPDRHPLRRPAAAAPGPLPAARPLGACALPVCLEPRGRKPQLAASGPQGEIAASARAVSRPSRRRSRRSRCRSNRPSRRPNRRSRCRRSRGHCRPSCRGRSCRRRSRARRWWWAAQSGVVAGGEAAWRSRRAARRRAAWRRAARLRSARPSAIAVVGAGRRERVAGAQRLCRKADAVARDGVGRQADSDCGAETEDGKRDAHRDAAEVHLPRP